MTGNASAIDPDRRLAAAGTTWFSFLTAHSSLHGLTVPTSLVTGLGLGGALGLAGLATVAVTTTQHAAKGTALSDALVHGYTAGFKVAVGPYLLAIALTLATITPLHQGTEATDEAHERKSVQSSMTSFQSALLRKWQ